MFKPIIKLVAQAKFSTRYGLFKIFAFKCLTSGVEHIALVKGKICAAPVLARLHSQCLTGDTLGSLRCDCGEQLQRSLELIKKANCGILLYLNQEGRGIGLTNKIKAYALQDNGQDTVEANLSLHFAADLRDYKFAAEMLKILGVNKIKLLTNNLDKVRQLNQYGIKVIKRVPLEIKPNQLNSGYLKAKKQKMGHKLNKV